MPGVFAGGDAANGPTTVIEAIAAGRRAAISIDKCIGRDGKLEFGMRNAEVNSPTMADEKAETHRCLQCDLEICLANQLQHGVE